MLVSTRGTPVGPALFEQMELALARTWALHDYISDTVRRQVGIATAEIIANIVEHGSARGHRPVHVGIEVSVGPRRLTVAVTDDSDEPRINLEAARMPGWDAERGRGLAIAKSVLDTLTYHRTTGMNHWLLTSKPF